MTKLIALFIIASGCVPAQTAKPAATDERWEYCVASSSSNVNSASGKVEANVTVCYLMEQGCRDENFAPSEPIPPELALPAPTGRETAPRGPKWFKALGQGDALRDRAMSKAISQLGKEGWELVSVVYPGADTGAPVRRGLYFKRRLR